MSEALLRCPMCGGEASVYGLEEATPMTIECNGCRTRTSAFSTTGAAIAAWNRRESQWVSVADALPAYGQTVLVAYEHGLAVATYRTRFASNWQGLDGPLWGVTHWAAVEGPKS